MKKMLFIGMGIAVTLLLSGCGKIIDGTVNGIAYTAHSVTGIDYPKKSGKIYLESTTLEDNKNVTPLNAQLYGFDNKTAKNMMQCDIIPELTDVLTEHGWKITKNKKEADYQIQTSVVYCGYADTWLSKSNRMIPMKKRTYYQSFLKLVKQKGLNLTGKELVENNPKALEKFHEFFTVKQFKSYFNVFDFKYKGAPANVMKMVHADNINAKTNNLSGNITADGIESGANSMQYSPKGGLAMMGVGLLLGMAGNPTYSGDKVQIKIYNPKNKKTEIRFIHVLSSMDQNVDKYKMTRYYADSFASGLFYK